MSELREQQKAERENLIVSSDDSDTTSDTSDLEETDESSKDQYPEKKGDGDGKPDPDRGGASSSQYQGLVYYVTAASTPVFPYGSKSSLPFSPDKGKNEGKQQTLQCGDGGYESDSQESKSSSEGSSTGKQAYVLQESIVRQVEVLAILMMDMKVVMKIEMEKVAHLHLRMVLSQYVV